MFLFDVKELSNLKFRLNFNLPAVTYRETGPVRLTVWINGHPLPSELSPRRRRRLRTSCAFTMARAGRNGDRSNHPRQVLHRAGR